jgi:hypothetical protein
MKGQHQIKILQAIEGGHVALSRKDGSFQVFRAFSAGDGAKVLEWVAKELGLDVGPAKMIADADRVPVSEGFKARLDAAGRFFAVGDEPAAPDKPSTEEFIASTLSGPLPDRKPVRSRAEKQRQFVAFIISRGGEAAWVRIPSREICSALQVTEPTALDIANRSIHEGAIEKRIVKGDRPEDRGRSYSEWRIAVQQAQPAEKESGPQATADEPKTVAAPPAPEVPPAAQAVKLETPAVEPIPPVISVPSAPIERLHDGVDGDPGLDKRARMVLLCLRQIADRQGQQQFEVQLGKLAAKAGVPKPSMPAIIARLRTAHDVIVKEPLPPMLAWRFDLSKVARVAEAS